MHRYGGNIDYVLNLDAIDGINLINEAFKQSKKDKLYQQWLFEHCLLLLGENSKYVSFGEFCGEKPTNNFEQPHHSKEEILAMAEKIKRIKNYDV